MEILKTEANFFPKNKATVLIDAAVSRINSRVKKSFDLFATIILDSSDTLVDSAVPNFLKNNPFGRLTKQFKYSIWDAKPEEYWHKPDNNRIDEYKQLYTPQGTIIENPNYGKPALSFRVYSGDAEIHPCIIDDTISEDYLSKMDQDRFIDVPNELRNQFEANIELALQDTCGRAIESAGQYFNSTYVTKAFDLPNFVHGQYSEDPQDIVCVSFFDEQDTYINYIKDAIEMIPYEKSVFFGLDYGITSDKCGVAIGYVENVGEVNLDGIRSYDPIINIPIAFAISRLPGEETSAQKIIDMIKWIHAKRTVYYVLTDTFQSDQFEQFCRLQDIHFKYMSVDKYLNGWKLTKDSLYRGKVHITKNTLLKNEMLNVYYDTDRGKVDHHKDLNAAGDIGSNSKDVLDAMVKVIWSIREAITDDIDGVMDPKIVSDSQALANMKAYTHAMSQNFVKRQLMNQIRFRR